MCNHSEHKDQDVSFPGHTRRANRMVHTKEKMYNYNECEYVTRALNAFRYHCHRKHGS